MMLTYFLTFLQTCVLEFPLYFVFLRPGRRLPQIIVAVLALNALTHPLVFFGFMSIKWSVLNDILIAELFAFTAEALACRFVFRLSWLDACAASGLANFFSWQLGSFFTYMAWSMGH